MKSTINAISYIDLLKKLRETDISVPAISRGRTKLHTERWTMYRFLATFGDSDRLTYPIAVKHQDRPDFCLEMADRQVGVEVTSAMPENFARALVLRDKFYPNAPLEPDHFRWGIPRLASKEILRILERSQNRLTGMGWVGDSVEHEWAGAIAESCYTKSEVLNSNRFGEYPCNWLLIYDNVPQAALDLQLGVKYLVQNLVAPSQQRTKPTRQFDCVFVETHETFVSIESGMPQFTKLRDIRRKRVS